LLGVLEHELGVVLRQVKQKRPGERGLFNLVLRIAKREREREREIGFEEKKKKRKRKRKRIRTHFWRTLKRPVPMGMGTPMMMHSLTPSIQSVLE